MTGKWKRPHRLAHALEELHKRNDAHLDPEVVLGIHKGWADRFSRYLGANSAPALRGQLEVAGNLAAMQRLPEAVELQEKAVEGLRRHRRFGPDHSLTVYQELRLAIWLLKVDRAMEATDILHHVADATVRALGPDDPESLIVGSWLGEALYKSGQVAAARRCYELLVPRFVISLGEEDPRTLKAIAYLQAIAEPPATTK
jgi:tetratricopeptide repeat protein